MVTYARPAEKTAINPILRDRVKYSFNIKGNGNARTEKSVTTLKTEFNITTGPL
jgi:hypothetical protein